MTNNKLLLDEYPLLILPKFAVLIGLNEAIILQQIHYWLIINEKVDKNLHDGKYWIYNSYVNMKKKDFPFWSTDTIKRTIHNLEKANLLIVGNYNKLGIDKTKWYTINYENLAKIQLSSDTIGDSAQPLGQNAPTKGAKCTDQNGKMHRPLPETSIETNTENITNKRDRQKNPESTNNLKQREKVFFSSLTNYLDKFDKKLIRNFYDYWTETNKSNSKMRFELEKTWNLNKRLSRWSNNEKMFNNHSKKTIHDQVQDQLNKMKDEN